MDVITIRHADEIPQALAEKLGTQGTRMIGTLWIDSHGVFKKGRALFVLGRDTITIPISCIRTLSKISSLFNLIVTRLLKS